MSLVVGESLSVTRRSVPLFFFIARPKSNAFVMNILFDRERKWLNFVSDVRPFKSLLQKSYATFFCVVSEGWRGHRGFGFCSRQVRPFVSVDGDILTDLISWLQESCAWLCKVCTGWGPPSWFSKRAPRRPPPKAQTKGKKTWVFI